MIWVGIIGVKGYFGEALERLVAGHPEAQLSTVMELQGLGDGSSYVCGSTEAQPGYWSMVNAVKKSDIIFNGLPGVVVEDVYSKALSHGKRIIDISGEHYLRDCLEENSGSSYPGSIYGLSELYRDKMKKASIAANPSSFCTGVVLGLAPLAAGSLVDVNSASIVAKSGITSLRRNDRLTEAGTANNEGIKTYKVDGMKYTEEVNEQMLTLFGKGTPASYAAYIIPGSKGITTTIKVSAHTGISGKDILDIYRAFYKDSPFVEVCTGGMIPSMRNGFNKSFCKIGASVDSDSGEIVVTTVLDDVLRGAAGQAIQTMNLMCDIDGKIGL